MWTLTSREPGLLSPLVTEDAVRDLEWCDSLQGVQNVLGGPAWESQVMDPLRKKIAFITLHHANNHITQRMNRNKGGLNGCISSFLLSQLFLVPVWR